MFRGYVKLWRKAVENPYVMKDAETFAVWCYLLLSASYKKRQILLGGSVSEIGPGELVTGRGKISSDLSISESKVERVLNWLENGQLIEQQTNSRGRLIRLVSWDKYQESEQPNEQQVDSKWTASEQQVNTYNNSKQVKHEKNEKESACVSGNSEVLGEQKIPFDLFLKEFARASRGKKCPFFFTETAKTKLTRIWNILVYEKKAKNPENAVKAAIAEAMSEMLGWIDREKSDNTPMFFEPDSIFEEKQFNRYLSKSTKGQTNDQPTTPPTP